MELIDVGKLVEDIEASKQELDYLMCRYEKCTVGIQIIEICREIVNILLVLECEQDNVVERVERNAGMWFKENGFVCRRDGENPYAMFCERELCVLRRFYDLESWAIIVEKSYGDVDKMEFAKAGFEEYLKYFSCFDGQNKTTETDKEDMANLEEVEKMVDKFEKLICERESLMKKYLKCLVRLQDAEMRRKSNCDDN